MKKLLIVTVLILVGFYLPFSFIMMSLNPIEWGIIGRAVFFTAFFLFWGYVVKDIDYKG